MKLSARVFTTLPVSKLLCGFLLAFQFLFLNVIVPGHTRGAICLSGKSFTCSLSDLGCPFCREPAGAAKSPTKRDASGCAICHLAMRITFQAPPDFRLTEFGLLYVAPPSRPVTTDPAYTVSRPPCRGPPDILPA